MNKPIATRDGKLLRPPQLVVCRQLYRWLEDCEASQLLCKQPSTLTFTSLKFMGNTSHTRPDCIPNTRHGIIHELQEGNNGSRASVPTEYVLLLAFRAIQDLSTIAGCLRSDSIPS